MISSQAIVSDFVFPGTTGKAIQDYDRSFPLLSDTENRVSEPFGLAYDSWEHHQPVLSLSEGQ